MANARNYWRYFTKLIQGQVSVETALENAAQQQVNMNKAKRIIKREQGRRARREVRETIASEYQMMARTEKIVCQVGGIPIPPTPINELSMMVVNGAAVEARLTTSDGETVSVPMKDGLTINVTDLREIEGAETGRLPVEGCGPTRVFTQEDHKNVVDLMRETYNFPAGGTYVVPESELQGLIDTAPGGWDQQEPEEITAHACTIDESQQPGVIHGPNPTWVESRRWPGFLETFTRDQLRKAFSAAGITGFRNARKDQFLRHAMSTDERKAVFTFLQDQQ